MGVLEFVGGPYDGDQRAVRATVVMQRLDVMALEPLALAAHGPADALPALARRLGTYVYRVGTHSPALLDWQRNGHT